MAASHTSSEGIGCLTVVGIVFVVLKIVGVEPIAAWSWWWVTAPFWGPLAITLAIIAIVALCSTLKAR